MSHSLYELKFADGTTAGAMSVESIPAGSEIGRAMRLARRRCMERPSGPRVPYEECVFRIGPDGYAVSVPVAELIEAKRQEERSR